MHCPYNSDVVFEKIPSQVRIRSLCKARCVAIIPVSIFAVVCLHFVLWSFLTTGMELNINWTLTWNFHCMLCYLTNPFLILLQCPSELQAGSLGLRYTLFAVINHHGTISGGHCEYLSSITLKTTSLLDVALSKRGDRWFCCDDSYVTECQEHNIVVSGQWYEHGCRNVSCGAIIE